MREPRSGEHESGTRVNIESLYCTIDSDSEYEPGVLNTFVQLGFKNSNFYKECMSSLAFLPPRNAPVFERQYLLEYHTMHAKS